MKRQNNNGISNKPWRGVASSAAAGIGGRNEHQSAAVAAASCMAQMMKFLDDGK